MKIFINKLFYNLLWLPLRLFSIFFLYLKLETQEDLRKINGPLIIVSSHASWIDPFLIGSVFPFWAKVYPIHFACWYKYFYSYHNIIFAWLLGNFPIKKGIELEKALKSPINLLKNKEVIGIFPEGKRIREKDKEKDQFKGKRGAAYLAIKTNSKILPVKIEGNMNMTKKGIFLRRYKIEVKIGKFFSLDPQEINRPEDLNKQTDFIMEKIKEI